MKTSSTTKVTQTSLGLSLKPSAPDSFPSVYADNEWDIAENGTSLKDKMGAAGSYTQHEINEKLAELAGTGGGGSTGGLSKVVCDSLADYEAIEEKDSNTLYLIKG